jgi:glycine hydroxymethyltransferase
MVIVDVSPLGLTGKQAEYALRQGRITVNRNAIPFDKNGPWFTSGVRLGTPALTTLGMGPQEMKQIGNIIADCLYNAKPTVGPQGVINRASAQIEESVAAKAQAQVQELLQAFPLYKELIIPESIGE